MAGNPAEFVKLFVDAVRDDVTLSHRCSSFRMHRPAEIVEKAGAVAHLAEKAVEGFHSLPFAQIHYRVGLAQSPAQLHDFAWHDLACCGAGNDSFKVTYVAYHGLKPEQIVLIVNEMLNHRISVFKLIEVHHRHCKPASEHAGSHR